MKEKMYTLSEVAEMEGLSLNGIRQRFWKSHADKSKIMTHVTFDRAGNKHLEMLFTAKQLVEFQMIGPKYQKHPKQETKKVAVKATQSLEELKALHPLVKDVRFFETSYFPEIVPVCFMTEED